MHKEYIQYSDDVVVVEDNGEQKHLNYYDQLFEVLERENLVEELEGFISEQEKSEELTKEDKFYPYNIGVGFLTCAFAYYLMDINEKFTNASEKVQYFATMLGIALPIAIVMEGIFYHVYKNGKKDKEGIKCQLGALKDIVREEEEKINQIEKHKTKSPTDSRLIVKSFVPNHERMEEIIEQLDIYYDIGYYGKKYYELYENGNLHERLKNIYEDKDIETIQKYFDDKGDVYIKTKKKK